MKIDRRSFLAFGIGGAAGTALSPLPWKITDDLSIWTQMWPWTPVPKDGEVSYVNSTCTLCPGGCGITVRKIENRAVKIEGMKGHPINNGGVCALGLSGLQLLYGPRRVKSPLKRVGKRGEGRWEKIGWDEAIGEVTEKMDELRTRDKPHTVAWISDSDKGTVPGLINRFLTAFGSPNFTCPSSIRDTYELTLQMMNGGQRNLGVDAENADFILSFGSGIIDGWGSPVFMFRANSKWRENKATVIQFEPRLSNTAAKSDQWIPIHPGTEGALALGLSHVIVNELIFSPFVKRHTQGFAEWKNKTLAVYTPDKVAEITGVAKSTIISLAKAFAGAKNPVAICGRGRGTTPGSLKEFAAVHALNALVGNMNRRGGVWTIPNTEYIDWPQIEMDETAARGIQQGRVDGTDKENSIAKYTPDRISEAITSGTGYPLEALFVTEANPLYSMIRPAGVKAAFEKIPFVAVFSPYMNETTANADLILPIHAHLERFEDVPAPLGFTKPYIGLSKPVVPPQYNTRHMGDVVILLANAMGGTPGDAFPWETYAECVEETLAPKWDTLYETGYWIDSGFRPAAWESAFETNSGRFEFINEQLASFPDYAPIPLDGDESSYPLVLVSYDSMRLANHDIADPPFMVKAVSDVILKDKHVFIEVNPETAKSLKLSEGKTARLTTPVNKTNVKIHLSEGIMPGVVAMPTGLGHMDNDSYVDGKGANFNEFIGPVEDPASGLNVAWGIRAKLEKV